MSGRELHIDDIAPLLKRLRRENKSVYFVQMEHCGNVKVGIAGNVAKRIDSFRTGCPEPLVLIASFRGVAADEAALHRVLRAFHLRGEWFSPGPWVARVKHADKWAWPVDRLIRSLDPGKE